MSFHHDLCDWKIRTLKKGVVLQQWLHVLPALEIAHSTEVCLYDDVQKVTFRAQISSAGALSLMRLLDEDCGVSRLT